jgi:predicted phage-related endonuclease
MMLAPNVVILHPATDEEWLGLRREDVTASQAAALLGAHPYTTAYQMWADKTGRSSEKEMNGADAPRAPAGAGRRPAAA